MCLKMCSMDGFLQQWLLHYVLNQHKNSNYSISVQMSTCIHRSYGSKNHIVCEFHTLRLWIIWNDIVQFSDDFRISAIILIHAHIFLFTLTTSINCVCRKRKNMRWDSFFVSVSAFQSCSVICSSHIYFFFLRIHMSAYHSIIYVYAHAHAQNTSRGHDYITNLPNIFNY